MACGRSREWSFGRSEPSPQGGRDAGLQAIKIRGADSSPRLTNDAEFWFSDGLCADDVRVPFGGPTRGTHCKSSLLGNRYAVLDRLVLGQEATRETAVCAPMSGPG
jgi:hypothetical protein